MDLISRQAAIAAIKEWGLLDGLSEGQAIEILADEEKVPSAHPEKMQLSKEDATKGTTFDCIDRQSAIDALEKEKPTPFVNNDDGSIDPFGAGRQNQWYRDGIAIMNLPSVQPEIIHCCDCIYYDPEHIEKNGVRYEYRDMPKDAFDSLGTGLVNSEYGINVGGRCCRDYNVGYSEDKRVFVSGQNYCGRAERRQDG